MFGFKKKQPLSLPELPPPPSQPDFAKPEGDIPQIAPATGPEELPAAPGLEHEEELAEVPAPELPEIPKPEYAKGVDNWKEEDYKAPELPERAEASERPAGYKPALPELVPVEEPQAAQPERALTAGEAAYKPVGPMFISVDDYRAIAQNSNRVRAKLLEAEGFMHRLGEIKAEEEKAFERWRNNLEEVERKLGHIDRVIAKAKR